MNQNNGSVKKSEFSKRSFMLIAGPCAIESAQQMESTAQILQSEKLPFMRGGIYKLRTHPDSFQGLGEAAIDLIISMKKKYGLKLVSEITDPRHISTLLNTIDFFQVGTRNMYNYELLKELGKVKKPVVLKRAFSATVKEWLLAAEYLVKGGNEHIILCERGIRTFETSTRNTVDLSGALVAQKESGWPVILDPSHGVGRADLVIPMALAGVACGLDGLLIEIHSDPQKALSDGQQALNFEAFRVLMKKVRQLLKIFDRSLLEKPSLEEDEKNKALTTNFFCRSEIRECKTNI